MLGASLAGQGKYADSEPLLLAGYEGLIKRLPTIPVVYRFNVEYAGAWIVEMYQDWGKLEKAADWAQNLQQASAAVSSSSRK